MKTTKIIAILLILNLFSAKLSFAQIKTWNKTKNNNILIYTPNDLKKEKLFVYMIPPPQEYNNLTKNKVFINYIKKVEKNIIGARYSWHIKKAKGNELYTSNVVNYKGKQKSFFFRTEHLTNRQVLIIQAISDPDPVLLKRYLGQLETIITDVKKQIDIKPSQPLTSAKKNKSSSKKQNNKSLKKITNYTPTPITMPVKTPKGFKEIRGYQKYGIQPNGTYGLTGGVIALFNDGTCTTRIADVFNKGTAKSRAEKPKYWNKCSFEGSRLKIKSYGSESFSKTYGNWKAAPGKVNEKLDGCYGNFASSSGGAYGTGVVRGMHRGYCFKPNGRFTTSRTDYAQGIFDPSTKVNEMNMRGYYRIDQYAVKFIYDDGTVITASFSYLDDEKEHIAINGKRLMKGY